MVKHVAAISCQGALKEVSNWTTNTAIWQTSEWVQNASSHLPRSRILQETDPQAANQTRLESCTIWSIEVQYRMICWREEKQCWFVDCITCNLRNLLALIFSLPLELFRITGVNSVVPTALQSLLASLTPESAKHPSKTHRKICETSRNTKKKLTRKLLGFRERGVQASSFTNFIPRLASLQIVEQSTGALQPHALFGIWHSPLLHFSTLHCETGVTPENSCEKALIIRQ